MEEKNKTGEFLKELRNEKGYTQEQLANKIHVTNKAISSWENGRSHPDPEMMKTLAKFYDITVDELYAGTRRDTKEILFKRKLKKLCIRIVISIFAILFLLLLTYFILTVQSVKFYVLYLQDDSVDVNCGYYIVNKNKSILHIDNLLELPNKNNAYVELYEKTKTENKILYSGFFSEFDLENKVIDDINEVYLKVIYTEDEETKENIYNINFHSKYNNHRFVDLSSSTSNDYENNSASDSALIDKLLELGFKEQSENLYFKEEKSKNEKTTTYVDINVYTYNKIVDNKESKKIISYYQNTNALDVQFLDMKENIYKEFNYEIEKERQSCVIGRCNNVEDVESLKEDIEIVKLFK